MAPKVILVSGATGKQGGAVIRALLNKPPPFEFKILALTRNTSSKSAQALASKSQIELLAGDLNDCPNIFEKAGGVNAVWGAFLVTVPALRNKGTENIEAKQGCNFIDAAVANQVKHLVFSSVDRGGPEKSDVTPTTIAHFASKFKIEQHLKENAPKAQMTWTVLRTVAFMENLMPNYFGKLFATWWADMGNTKMQIIATKDIGIFTAQSFTASNSEEYKNTAISIAGDELNYAEAKEIFWKVIGRSIPNAYGVIGNFVQMMVPDLGAMFKWIANEGCKSDIKQCKKMNPDLLDFETWLKEESKFKR